MTEHGLVRQAVFGGNVENDLYRLGLRKGCEGQQDQ